MTGGTVRAYPPDRRALLLDGGVGVPELARLGGAARRVVLRVEVQEDPLAALVLQAVDHSAIVRKGDRRRCFAHDGDPRLGDLAGCLAHSESVAGDSITSRRPRPRRTWATSAKRTLESPRTCPNGSGSPSNP